MVKVGDFWIDRYEVSVVDATTYNGGKCDGTGTVYGSGGKDDFPLTFPDSGDFSVKLYACSRSGNVPSRMMTWFQASQACLLASKHLCSNEQWQWAAAGTYDPGKYDGTSGGSCHTGGISPRKTGQAGAVPGASASCISRWGAEDMAGNLFEWVAWWTQTGKAWMVKDGEDTPPWKPGYGDGQDKTWNLDGRAFGGNGWVNGLPAAGRRGGTWDYGVLSGTFAVSLSDGPSASDASAGGRCCRN